MLQHRRKKTLNFSYTFGSTEFLDYVQHWSSDPTEDVPSTLSSEDENRSSFRNVFLEY
jgi:hypothetical protein